MTGRESCLTCHAAQLRRDNPTGRHGEQRKWAKGTDDDRRAPLPRKRVCIVKFAVRNISNSAVSRRRFARRNDAHAKRRVSTSLESSVAAAAAAHRRHHHTHCLWVTLSPLFPVSQTGFGRENIAVLLCCTIERLAEYQRPCSGQ